MAFLNLNKIDLDKIETLTKQELMNNADCINKYSLRGKTALIITDQSINICGGLSLL